MSKSSPIKAGFFKLLPAAISLLALGMAPETGAAPPPRVVDSVDLARYLGKYYEIARLPNFFQKNCAYGTTAEYSLRADGDITVINSCYEADGELLRAEGVAWIVDDQTRAKLKVSFFPFGLKWFGGDYWIIGLGADYQFSIIGHPERKYGWLLSRTPQLSEAQLNEAKRMLAEQGYDFAAFSMTEHKPPASD